MPARVTPESLLSKHLGKEAASAVLSKIDQMAAKGATARQIESAATALINAQIERTIMTALLAKLGPLEPIKIKPIQAAIKPSLAIKVNTGMSTKVSSTVSIKVGPGTEVRAPR